MHKLAIYIASHIRYDDQLNRLNDAIKSVLNNKNQIFDICLSISYLEQYKTAVKNFLITLDNFNLEKTTPNKIYYISHNEQLFQMEHIHQLHLKFSENYNLLMFLDDDDTYHPRRIEIFLSEYIISEINPKVIGVREYSNNININSHNCNISEYWGYLIDIKLLNQFFQIVTETNNFHLLKHKYADMYFRNYLATYKFNDEIFITIKPNDLKSLNLNVDSLYNYNSHENQITKLKSVVNNNTDEKTINLIIKNLTISNFQLCTRQYYFDNILKFIKDKNIKEYIDDVTINLDNVFYQGIIYFKSIFKKILQQIHISKKNGRKIKIDYDNLIILINDINRLNAVLYHTYI